MTWFTKLFKSRSGAYPPEDPRALWLYVECGRCGTPLAVRVDRRNELSPEYETGGALLRKEMMDGVCFQLMYAELHFDAQGKVVSQQIEGGKFIPRAEYETLAHKKGE